MPVVFDVHEAKIRLSQLIAMAEAGDEVVIARRGKPVARLIALRDPAPGRRFGALAGVITLDDSFFDPLPEDELAAWG